MGSEPALDSSSAAARRGHLLLAGGVLLSTFMSALTTQTIIDHQRRLSAAEAETLHGLLAYTAARQAVPVALIEQALLSQFQTETLPQLAGRLYEPAVHFLLSQAQAAKFGSIISASAAPVSRRK